MPEQPRKKLPKPDRALILKFVSYAVYGGMFDEAHSPTVMAPAWRGSCPLGMSYLFYY